MDQSAVFMEHIFMVHWSMQYTLVLTYLSDFMAMFDDLGGCVTHGRAGKNDIMNVGDILSGEILSLNVSSPLPPSFQMAPLCITWAVNELNPTGSKCWSWEQVELLDTGGVPIFSKTRYRKHSVFSLKHQF